MNSEERQSVVDLYKVLLGIDRHDEGLDDELSWAQAESQQLKALIDDKSRENHVLEQDVGFLDERIKLLIQNRSRLSADEAAAVLDPDTSYAEVRHLFEAKRRQTFGQLFFLLQSEPQHIAHLCAQKMSLVEVDMLLETVMFSIFGNQFNPREEHLLLVVYQLVLTTHFDNTSEFPNLLRANTAVTRMMQSYTRRGMGQAYLHRLLSPALKRMMSADFDLDINPSHVFADLAEGRWADAAPFKPGDREHPAYAEVQAEVERRFINLQKYTGEFMALVFASVEAIPYGIRWMAKQVRLLAQRKFPETSRSQLSSLLGGFFFLRYLNPAIVSPHAYLLVKDMPEGRARRNLTVLAKTVQLVANQATASKEMWTVDMAGWIRSYEAPVQQFLHDICGVPDFYDSLELDQYIAMQALQTNMTVYARDLVDMWYLLSKYPSPEASVQKLMKILGTPLPLDAITARQRRVEIKLPLPLVRDSELAYDSQSEALKASVQFLKTKNLFVTIRRLLPSLHDQPLQSLIDDAAHSPNPRLAEYGMQAQLLYSQYPTADQKLLETEVDLETSRLGSLKEKLEIETKSLQRVYTSVIDRNEYLESQLDVFRSYLANIRGEATVEYVFSPRRFAQRGFLEGPWPWSEHASSKLQIIIRPRKNHSGMYTLTIRSRSKREPLLELWFTLDDLLAIDSIQGNIDLEFLVLKPQPLVDLIS